jgi:hypothetical protein
LRFIFNASLNKKSAYPSKDKRKKGARKNTALYGINAESSASPRMFVFLKRKAGLPTYNALGTYIRTCHYPSRFRSE